MSVKITELRFVGEELQFRTESGGWLKTSPRAKDDAKLVDYAMRLQEELKRCKRKAGALDERPSKAARRSETHRSPSSQVSPKPDAGAEEEGECVHCGKEIACIYCGALFKSYGGNKFCYDECKYHYFRANLPKSK